jgi:hypothetical protein
MKKLLLAMALGSFAPALSLPDTATVLKDLQTAKAQIKSACATNHAQPTKYKSSILLFKALGMPDALIPVCRHLIPSMRPALEKALAAKAPIITANMTIPHTGDPTKVLNFEYTMAAPVAREILTIFDELERDLPTKFHESVDALEKDLNIQQSDLKRQVNNVTATINGTPVTGIAYHRPVPMLVWGILGVAGVAAVYGIYKYFYPEKKEEKPVEAIA